jgi:hypothetical protein
MGSVLFILYHCQCHYRTRLYIQVTRRMAYKKQELLTLSEHLISPPFFLVGSVLLIFLVFCVVLLCVFTFWVSCCDVRCVIRIQAMFGLSFPPVSCLWEGSCLIYVFCVCLHIMVSNSYCVPNVASFSGLFIFEQFRYFLTSIKKGF